MNTVIEIDEIRQIVDSCPLEGAIFAIARPHGLERRAIRPHLRVAIHAGLCRWNARKRTFLNRRVAVPAVNTNSRNVMLMAERYRLLANDARFRKVWRTNKHAGYSHKSGNDENRAEDAHSRQRIRTAMKYLSHDYTSAPL
jgi:hypothetical protein